MAVSPIARYSSPPTSTWPTPQACPHASYDFEFTGRSAPPLPSASPPSQKPVVSGLSCLFSSTSPVKHASSPLSYANSSEDELSSSFRCYPSLGSFLKTDQSPVSVLQGPASCSSSGIGSSRSPPSGILQGSIGKRMSGFARHALASYVDYDSPSFIDSSSVILDELPFDMEDNFMESSSEPYAKDLLLGAERRHKIFNDDLVVKAFYEAEKAHRGQMRASGDPYLEHCVETAVLLAVIGANSTVVAAGLLHDTLDDSSMSYDYIFQRFGAGVADLVEGVSKLSQLSKLARENNIASQNDEVDRLHTMFLAMDDARAVLIKLADRLHNMMTLDALPFVKQQRFAKETLEVFAPLANRLGIFSWKEQLENLCFKHLYPDQHKELSSKLMNSFDQAMIASAVENLENALEDASVSYHTLLGRHKSLYSIFAKMLRKKLTMDEIHDIHGLRLIVEKEEDCYNALRVVHQLWSEVPGKFKDYIKHPKFNGYQSLHTVVMGEDMVPLEVQIRTKEMHLHAEFGFAAHWRYKEGDCKHSSFVLQMVEWARWVLSWQCEAMSKDQSTLGYADSIRPTCTFPSHSEDCPYSYKHNSAPDGPVLIIMLENDQMSVQEFPADSTVLDLLERVGQGSFRWTPYGYLLKEELRPRVNHEPVHNPTCKLKMGDIVDITPAIPDKALTEYREEIQRMYDGGLTVSASGHAASNMVGSRS